MKTAFSGTETEKSERRIFFMAPVAAVELAPEKDETPEETAWYAALSGEEDFTQNTTAWD